MIRDSPSDPPPKRVLVADDEPHIRRVLVTILENDLFTVDQVSDGDAAIERVREDVPYDFILLDLMMPGASGIEVLDEVRRNPTRLHTPVFILTAKGQDTDRDAALARGATDFLTKPFSPKKLLARIHEILGDAN
ncbi:MAG: response regulator [Gemmatimonadota bacterium]|nr:response regulator [Gemmatimonadota bacterium]MDH5758623.1 response regulator [Gemmatimonadota bacterium]